MELLFALLIILVATRFAGEIAERAGQAALVGELIAGVILGLFARQHGGRAFRQVLSEGAHRPGADWRLVEKALSLTEREPRQPLQVAGGAA